MKRCIFWVLVISASLGGCHRPGADVHSPMHRPAVPTEPFGELQTDDPLTRQCVDDPLAFLKMCREQYLSTIRDYRCVFHIHERDVGASDALGPQQEIEVRFRETPYSVDMRWTRNPLHATRVHYVAGRWRRGGREYAIVYPSGLLSLLTPAGVKVSIHAPEVRAASRRAVDDFGFRRTLELIIENCEKAQSDPQYELRCLGEAELDNRPCLVLERKLPYANPQGPYPDRLLRIYIDREWLVPTGCYSFADDEGRQTIGTYETTSVEMNAGLIDEDF